MYYVWLFYSGGRSLLLDRFSYIIIMHIMYLLEFQCVLPHPNTTHSCPGCMTPLMSKHILFTKSFNRSLDILISAMSWGLTSTPPSNQNDCTLLICCCLPTPMTLASGGGGEPDVPDCGPPASFSLYLASSTAHPTGCVHKSRGNNVARMWVQLKR